MGTAMSEPSELSPELRERIFKEDVLPKHRLSGKTSLENPRAIILAGEPGAGKGTLPNAAKAELHGDVVTIDPDALRDHDPRATAWRTNGTRRHRTTPIVHRG
jgi:adenylylsulfate kinase-like enzyme